MYVNLGGQSRLDLGRECVAPMGLSKTVRFISLAIYQIVHNLDSQCHGRINRLIASQRHQSRNVPFRNSAMDRLVHFHVAEVNFVEIFAYHRSQVTLGKRIVEATIYYLAKLHY